MHIIFFCGHYKQFHVTCKEGHCLGTSQADNCDLGVGISTVLEIIWHFLFKGERPWDNPVWSWLHTITCSLTQGTRMYVVYGLGSQRFLRYWSTSGLRGTGPFPMVMMSMPSNAPCCKEQEYIWFRGRDLNGFWDISCFRGDGTTVYGHDVHTIRYYLIQETRIYMV
jgi:hypothetical protein